MRNEFIAVIRRPLNGIEWKVTFPDLPDCQTVGDSLPQAIDNARAALASHLAVLAIADESLPTARRPGDMLLAANEDPDLARQMIGAVLKVINPNLVTTLRATVSQVRRQTGYYGEERPLKRA